MKVGEKNIWFVCCVILVTVLVKHGVIAIPSEVQPQQYPYHVYVHGTFWCSGTLISKDYVLTNGFCVSGAIAATVYLGFKSNPFYEGNRQEPNTQTIDSNQVILHQDYTVIRQQRYLNNIALIKLSQSAVLSDRIQPVLLASKAQSLLIYGQTGNLVSWHQQYLSSVLVRISYQDTCQVAYGPDYFTSQEFCGTWVNPQDVLVATGSPFSINGKVYGQRTGTPCPQLSFKCEKYLVLLNISHFLDWISQQSGIGVEKLTGESNGGGEGCGDGSACCKRVEKGQDEILKRLDNLRVLSERLDARQQRIDEFLQRLLPSVSKSKK